MCGSIKKIHNVDEKMNECKYHVYVGTKNKKALGYIKI